MTIAQMMVPRHLTRACCVIRAGFYMADRQGDVRVMQDWRGHTNVQKLVRYTTPALRRFRQGRSAGVSGEYVSQAWCLSRDHPSLRDWEVAPRSQKTAHEDAVCKRRRPVGASLKLKPNLRLCVYAQTIELAPIAPTVTGAG